jgi:hypothetical protein
MRRFRTNTTNWEREFETGKTWAGVYFLFFVTRQAEAKFFAYGAVGFSPWWGKWPWALRETFGPGSARRRPGRRHRGAPPDGHQSVGPSAAWFPPHTSCGGCRGGVLVPQVARSAVSALRGWSGEPHKSVEIRWNGIGVVRGWSPPRTGQVCERISAQTPWIPEPKIRV